MRANNSVFPKYIKLLAAMLTEWIDNPPPLSRFDLFKENVTQTVFNLISLKKAYCLLIRKIKYYQ